MLFAMDCSVSFDDVVTLFNVFRQCAYRPGSSTSDNQSEAIEKKCEALIAKDYKYYVLKNLTGDLAGHYPSRIFLLEKEIGEDGCDSSADKSVYDIPRLRKMILNSRNARVRTRFPIPVILVNGKNVCRSSTLSSATEAATRISADYLTQTIFQVASEETALEEGSDTEDNLQDPQLNVANPLQKSFKLFSLDDLRNDDIKLLNAYSVNLICDLMVENKKRKYLLPVSSSEKIDKLGRYNGFNIWSFPYPGCEFFKEYSANEYKAEGLMFDFQQNYCDAEMSGPSDSIASKLGIDFKAEYKTWDLVKLTQNYIKVLLRYIMDEKSGILIHCISGWDRTPLFISLLRLSLWADGKVHKSLSVIEMFYFTLAYDWYLFGHQLPDRISKGEEILCFCFHFLKYLTGDEFSTVPRQEDVLSHDPQLQDPLLERSSRTAQGSNSSLNSSSSSLSNRSQDNHPSVIFQSQVESADEGNEGNVSISKESPHCQNFPEVTSVSSSPVLSSRSGSHLSLNGNTPPSPATSSKPAMSTSPVAVPHVARQRTESASSTGFGSWQIIAGACGPRGTESLRSSINSPSEINQNLMSDHLMNQPGVAFWELPTTCLNRKERLEAIETLFHKLCITVVDMSPTEMGMFSSLYKYAMDCLSYYADTYLRTTKTTEKLN